jgi:hypothetical protein
VSPRNKGGKFAHPAHAVLFAENHETGLAVATDNSPSELSLPGSGGQTFLDSGYQLTPFAVVRSYEETYSLEEI